MAHCLNRPPSLFAADNEHVYMELSQKLCKYCPKEWKKEASKVGAQPPPPRCPSPPNLGIII